MRITTALLCLTVFTSTALAQTSAPATTVPSDIPAEQAIVRLREGLIDSFNKGDMDRLLSYLDPDVVVTWQNAEVCRGPEQVRAYYNRVMTGPDRVVTKVAAAPVVDSRHIFGDWAVSSGSMNDHFTLTDGADLALNSRFSATVARRGIEWKVTSFHASVNMFDNPIVHTAVKRTSLYAGLGGAVAGLVVGVVVGLIAARRRGSSPTASR